MGFDEQRSESFSMRLADRGLSLGPMVLVKGHILTFW